MFAIKQLKISECDVLSIGIIQLNMLLEVELVSDNDLGNDGS